MREGQLITRTWPAANFGRIGRAGQDEPALSQHPLRSKVVTSGRRVEGAEAVPVHRQAAHFPHGRGRYAPARDVPRDPVAKIRGTAPGEIQVEPAQDRAILSNEHIISALTGILLSKQRPVLLGEMLKEAVTPVSDKSREVVAVRQLKGQDSRFMAGPEQLKIRHQTTLLSLRFPGRASAGATRSGSPAHPSGVMHPPCRTVDHCRIPAKSAAACAAQQMEAPLTENSSPVPPDPPAPSMEVGKRLAGTAVGRLADQARQTTDAAKARRVLNSDGEPGVLDLTPLRELLAEFMGELSQLRLRDRVAATLRQAADIIEQGPRRPDRS